MSVAESHISLFFFQSVLCLFRYALESALVFAMGISGLFDSPSSCVDRTIGSTNDDSVRRRNTNYGTCAQWLSSGYCAYGGRRRGYGGEAADTCKTTCGSAFGSCATPVTTKAPTPAATKAPTSTCADYTSSDGTECHLKLDIIQVLALVCTRC